MKRPSFFGTETKKANQPIPTAIKLERTSGIFIAALIIVFFFVTPISFAQTTQEAKGPALWSIRDEDTKIYLFGTIHLMKKDVDWFKDPIREAFEEATTLVTEIDQKKFTEQEQMKLLKELALLPSGENLSHIISEKTWAELFKFLKPLGMKEEMLNTWKPWYAGLIVTNIMAYQEGFNPQYGIDTVLSAEAEKLNLDIIGLEEPEFQFTLFDSLDREESIYFLKDALKEREKIAALFTDLKDAWLSQDFSKLESLLLESKEENKEFYDTIFTNRNRNWVKTLDELMSTKGVYFVAVGTGHLIGSESLISMMKETGYEIEKEF